ncbi:MAG: manganese efflux pump MntP family protein [Clostridia bacterium]|nr:manganese efflux pump MntP family protein [Clostridia bacterium]
MDTLSIVLTALALAVDAMCVSISSGLSVRKLDMRKVLLMALLFGCFQFAMPVFGWLLGLAFHAYIEAFDHWIAFGLLAFLGGKLIYESSSGCDDVKSDPFAFWTIVIMAIATSIDALAVGISFASLTMSQERFWFAVVLIGVVAFALSFAGALLGKKLGELFQKRSKLIAGIVLVLIGVRILLEHLGVFA